MNRIIRYSLMVLAMCLIAMCANAQTSPISALPVKTVNGKAYHYYVVQPKETIYSLSHKLGIDKKTIEKYNPTVKDGLRVHETLYFPADDNNDNISGQSADIRPEHSVIHKAKKGESAYAIAHKYGITVDELAASNPGILDGVNKNDNIVIPQPTTSEEPALDPYISSSSDGAAQTDSIFSDNNDNNPDYVSIVAMLPLQTDRDKPSKQALHYTDFIKGLLMAVDTTRTANKPIQVRIFDTYENADTVSNILQRLDFSSVNYIIAPEDSTQIELIATTADSTSAKVLNMFAVRNTAQKFHKSLIQGNIPHELMYNRAVNGFISQFQGYTPVIVTNLDEDADKSKFTDMLMAALTAQNIDFKTVNFNNTLDNTALEWMTETNRYVFVPSGSSRVVLNSILPAILSKKAAAPTTSDIQLFGYPEWIIIRGDLQQKLHEAGTTIYSRFVMNPDGYRTRNLENRFREWYGSAMIPTAPMYGSLGFDTGMWIINSSLNPDTNNTYTGVQNGFSIIEDNTDLGSTNTALFFINFMPNGLIESTIL